MVLFVGMSQTLDKGSLTVIYQCIFFTNKSSVFIKGGEVTSRSLGQVSGRGP